VNDVANNIMAFGSIISFCNILWHCFVIISNVATVTYYTYHPANRVQDITVLLIVILGWNILPECVNFTTYNDFKQWL